MFSASTFSLDKFPTKQKTDFNVLYQGLGSFWTQVFQEKDTVKGYTLGMTQELIQSYYNLVDAVNAFSVHDVPIFHKELWYPLVIKKSQFNTAPFVFRENDAVFGEQPTTDIFFQGVTFKFGLPKTPASKIFAFTPPADFSGVPVIANRILSPSLVMINGTDYVLNNGVLFFNIDLFNEDSIPKADLIGENGVKVQYTDLNGVVQDEQIIILWCYNTKVNNENLFENFGYIFDLNAPNDDKFKKLLESVFDLYVDGPTVHNIRTLAAAMMGLPSVIENGEIVEEIFEDDFFKFVVTDKNVYKFELRFDINPEITLGKSLFAGDQITDAIEYYDNVFFPKWWLNKIKTKVAFSQYVFLGSYKQQLVLQNTPTTLSVTYDGKIVFPIEGLPEDVATFHSNLDNEAIKERLGLNNGDVIVINPLDFVFDNFIRDNTAMLKFKFDDSRASAQFLNFMYLFKEHLPKHVYFIMLLEMDITPELYDALNDAIQVQYPLDLVTLNADGSDSAGFINSDVPQAAIDDPDDFRIFLINKLFSLGKGPELTNVLVNINTSSGGDLQINAGQPFQTIPVGSSTATVRILRLLDFS